jgi:hypothetical protein
MWLSARLRSSQAIPTVAIDLSPRAIAMKIAVVGGGHHAVANRPPETDFKLLRAIYDSGSSAD